MSVYIDLLCIVKFLAASGDVCPKGTRHRVACTTHTAAAYRSCTPHKLFLLNGYIID